MDTSAPVKDHPELDEVAAALVRQLLRRPTPMTGGAAAVRLAAPDGDLPGAVLVDGTAPGRAGAVVAAAVADDTARHDVVRYAAALARRRGVPLRVVHVWAGAGAAHERMAAADLLLSEVLYEQLGTPEADAAEREILHDRDAAGALAALSVEFALLVAAARGPAATTGEPLGGTVRELAGRTACPLAVLPRVPVLSRR